MTPGLHVFSDPQDGRTLTIRVFIDDGGGFGVEIVSGQIDDGTRIQRSFSDVFALEAYLNRLLASYARAGYRHVMSSSSATPFGDPSGRTNGRNA